MFTTLIFVAGLPSLVLGMCGQHSVISQTLFVMNKRLSIYKCPRCQQQLFICDGNGMNPKDGITIHCETKGCFDCGKHGKNEKEAFDILCQMSAKCDKSD